MQIATLVWPVRRPNRPAAPPPLLPAPPAHLFSLADPDAQQRLVGDVDEAVDRLCQHGGARRHEEDRQLGHEDQHVGADRGVDRMQLVLCVLLLLRASCRRRCRMVLRFAVAAGVAAAGHACEARGRGRGGRACDSRLGLEVVPVAVWLL